MPQQNRRSFGYRFVTCDDPSGVMECGTIRRSRAKYQKMEAVIENPRKAKSPVRLRKDPEAESRRRSEGSGGSAAVQLSEVSRGAQKLNRMIETWSKGASFEAQSTDIAKDLLKGALDLQESLILLGKLQEATKYVAQLKQKAEKTEDSQKDVRFQKPRILVDEVLGTYKFCRKEFDSICDVPSTSSSQSSTLNSNDAAYYAESGAFSTAITQQRSAGRSNVIAKLMGLEEIPLKKRIDQEKNSQWKRPSFDTDVDKFSKPQFEVEKVGKEPRSLKEILEGMQFKGLLKVDSVGNRKHGNDNHPPIVLIKPFAAPVMKAKEHLVQEERILRTEVMLKNVKMKEEILKKSSDGQEKVDRSDRFVARKEVKEYESSGSRSKGSDRTKEGSHSKKQLPTPVSKKSPKSDADDWKPGEVQKARRNSGKYLEEPSRSRMSFPDPRHQDYTEQTTTRLVRPGYSGPDKMKNETTLQSRTGKNVPNGEGHRAKSSDHNRSLKVKRITIAREKDIRQNEISAVECEKIDDENNRRIEMDSVRTEASSSTMTLTSVEETDQAAAILRLQEDSSNKQGDFCDVKPATSENKEIGDLDSEDYHVISLSGENNRAFMKRSDEKALLWSDSTFLAHLEDLFQSFGIYPTILKSIEKKQLHSVGEKLYLDCANDFIERKSLQVPQNLDSIPFASRGIGPSLMCMDKLIQEVCEGIDDLNGWCKFADGHLSADGFYALLKRDMWSANGTWEFGWKDGFSHRDVEQVVSDMEKMVLGWLIEEAIAEV